MTNTTRKLAKPKHDPKLKNKTQKKKSNPKKSQGSRKRAITDSDSSEDEEVSSSDDSDSARRTKKASRKRQHVESDSEVEMVADDKMDKDIEEVEDGVGNQLPDEQEVIPYHYDKLHWLNIS